MACITPAWSSHGLKICSFLYSEWLFFQLFQIELEIRNGSFAVSRKKEKKTNVEGRRKPKNTLQMSFQLPLGQEFHILQHVDKLSALPLVTQEPVKVKTRRVRLLLQSFAPLNRKNYNTKKKKGKSVNIIKGNNKEKALLVQGFNNAP